PRRMHEIHLRICRMNGPAVHAAARWPADDHGCWSVPQIVALRHEIRNLIESANDEIDELHLTNRPQTQVAHSAGRADDGAFADGRVDHTLPAKALEQPFAGLERAAVHADILANQ